MKPKEDSPQSVLKPCPFCGLHVELVSAKTYPNGERSPSYIKCKRCNYHIAGYEDKDVISQWNTRSAIRKEFCPNCEAETPCTHEAELFVCDICGEDFAKYIVSRNCSVSDENNNPDYYKHDAVSAGKVSVDVKQVKKRDLSDAEIEELGAQEADCSISNRELLILSVELARRTASLHYANTVCMEQKHVIDRLKEDAERLASNYVIEAFPHEWVCRGGCHHWARFGEQIDHAPDCPITLHRALMKELE